MKVTRKFRRICEIAEVFTVSVKKDNLLLYDGLIKDRQVVIRSDLPEQEAAWTVGHELGHLLLHWGRGDLTEHPDEAAEAEADRVADACMILAERIKPWNKFLAVHYLLEIIRTIEKDRKQKELTANV